MAGVKKVKKESDDVKPAAPKMGGGMGAGGGGERQMTQMEFCREIIKELFNKRHAVSGGVTFLCVTLHAILRASLCGALCGTGAGYRGGPQ